MLVREKSIIGKMLDIQPKTKSGLILSDGSKTDRIYFDEHPFQMEVFKCGNIELIDTETKEMVKLQPKDIIYLDRDLGQNEYLIFEGKEYGKVLEGNIILVKQHKDE